MRAIDRLLWQVRELISEKFFDFDTNEDDFINALGVDPEKYRVDYPNGDHGYDMLGALNDVAQEVWNE